jgi:diguanylate cyclase (GGDEF)-like protein
MIDGGVNPAVSLQRANRALKHAKERRDTASVDSTYERRTDPSRETQVDALTGLLNRQALSSLVMPREVERATQSGQPLALLIVDLDELKPLNDLFGHATGDLVLTGVADTVTAVVGREELVFRIGGDEFAVLLPLPLQDACDTADAILRAISRRTFATHAPGSGLTQVGVSIGVAVLSGATPASDVELAAQALFTTADDAMYEAKHRGNCWIAKVVGATAEPAVR